jgi:hypothetical protein
VEKREPHWWYGRRRRLYLVREGFRTLAGFSYPQILLEREHLLTPHRQQQDGFELPEITLFMPPFLAVIGAMYLGAAFACYLAGPFFEKSVPPESVRRDRRTVYGFGLVIAMMVPFFPAMVVAARMPSR